MSAKMEQKKQRKPKPAGKLAKAAKPLVEKYMRGSKPSFKGVHDKKLKAKLAEDEKEREKFAEKAAWRELLLPEDAGYVEAEGMERTFKFKQADIASAVDIASAQKHFELKLPDLGPYQLDYSRDGRHLVIGGRKGHLAVMDWQSRKLLSEVQVNETVRSVRFLHVHNMFAVAQKQNVFIYDSTGVEMHCLRHHKRVASMQYLPYHFLLVSAGLDGHLCYQDTSTGKLVADLNVRGGRLSCMAQNPQNAVIHLGHQNGVVSLWTPNSGRSQVQMLCHRAAVTAVAVDRSGMYMATSGVDGRLRVWDIRTYKALHTYSTPQPARSLCISQRGLLAAGCNTDVRIWRDSLVQENRTPYLEHHFTGQHLNEIQFCPYEDVLGIGHSAGFASLLVPGAGEANFDALESNPFQTKRQKQEMEVKKLLEKLQPEMITLDTSMMHSVSKPDKGAMGEEEEEKPVDHFRPRHRMKGKSSAASRFRRVQAVKDQQRRQRVRRASRGKAARKS